MSSNKTNNTFATHTKGCDPRTCSSRRVPESDGTSTQSREVPNCQLAAYLRAAALFRRNGTANRSSASQTLSLGPGVLVHALFAPQATFNSPARESQTSTTVTGATTSTSAPETKTSEAADTEVSDATKTETSDAADKDQTEKA